MYPLWQQQKYPEYLHRLPILGIMFYICTGHAMAADGVWPWVHETETDEVALILVGDFNVQKRTNPAAALVHVLETLNRADLVYANLEGLLVESKGADQDLPNKTGWTHLGPEAVQALEAGNIQVVGVANNVAYGRDNIMSSLAVLDAHDIAHTGAGKNIEAAHEPAIVEVGGVRFGFLQYTSKWYDEAEQMATTTAAGIARLKSPDGENIDPGDMERLMSDIQRLRPQVDVLLVSTHTRDGQDRGERSRVNRDDTPPPTEADLYSLLPVNERLRHAEPYQRQLARLMIDAGVDIVFGHGCHMLQAVEVYQGKPVLHCLGNFASDWIRVRNYRHGLAARVIIADRRPVSVSLVPVSRDEDNNVMLLDPGTGEGAGLFEQLQALSAETDLQIEGREIILPVD